MNSTKNKAQLQTSTSLTKSASMGALSYRSHKSNRHRKMNNTSSNSSIKGGNTFDFKCFIQEMKRMSDDESRSSWSSNNNNSPYIEGLGLQTSRIATADEMC